MPPKKPPVVRKPVAKPAAPVRGKPTMPPGKRKPGEKATAAAKAPAKPKGPSKEEVAAIKIQKYCRRFLAKKELQKLKAERETYDELIEKLQNQAFVDMVNAERERAEEQFQREQEQRRRKTAEKKREKAMLEAAFDDELDEMEKLVKQCLSAADEDGIGTDDVGLIKRAERRVGKRD